ncbi:twin-arginine translocation signal domain-containing protein, partial [candidate division KSB1 bacterium]|nr:twin-arginine translocation signal domain-containing protein [candidate division KSB1 bacterium]
MQKLLNRRDFMKGTAAAAMGVAIGLSPEQMKMTRVVLIRHKDALDDNSKHNATIIQQMLDEAVMKLLNKKDAADA